MLWINKEDSRLVKAWESTASIGGATSSVALSPSEEFFVCAKVGFIEPELQDIISAKTLADRVVDLIIKKGWASLPFQQTADNLEYFYSRTPADMQKFVEEVEITLVQNKVRQLEETERQIVQPIQLEPAI